MGSLWKFVACLRFTDLNFILKSVKRSPRECKRNRSGIKRNLCQKGDYVIYGAIRRRRSKSWSQIENFTRERSFIESFAIFDTANYSEAVIKTVKALNKCFARAFASQNSFRGVCYACDGGWSRKFRHVMQILKFTSLTRLIIVAQQFLCSAPFLSISVITIDNDHNKMLTGLAVNILSGRYRIEENK